jgi:2-oxoglutarate ferredoxin oxidoreductase subunit beta
MDYREYLRVERLPHVWCPGCGHGMIAHALACAMAELGLDPKKTVVIGGLAAQGARRFSSTPMPCTRLMDER